MGHSEVCDTDPPVTGSTQYWTTTDSGHQPLVIPPPSTQPLISLLPAQTLTPRSMRPKNSRGQVSFERRALGNTTLIKWIGYTPHQHVGG